MGLCPAQHVYYVLFDADSRRSPGLEAHTNTVNCGTSDSIVISNDLPEPEVKKESRGKGLATENDIRDRHELRHHSPGRQRRRRHSVSPFSDSDDSYSEVIKAPCIIYKSIS
jgi:hypothetical protein